MNQRSYKATGINLKAMPMGESDRLVTVLTKEYGLIRAIAPGARKHKSRLGGRSGMFVVNELMFAKGKSLDKLIQAETLQSFPGLSRDLAKLTTSQYLAELALAQALTDQPQEELYSLLIEHLERIEAAAKPDVLPCLAQATFHMLALAGVAPEVFRCCLSRSPLTIELGNPDWQVGFSVSSGGAVDLDEVEKIKGDRLKEIQHIEQEWQEQRNINRHDPTLTTRVREPEAAYAQSPQQPNPEPKRSNNHRWQAQLQSKVSQEVIRNLGIVGYLSAPELALMQQLNKPELLMTSTAIEPNRQFGSKSGTIQQSPINSSATRAERSPARQSERLAAERLAVVSSVTESSGPHRHVATY